MPAKIPLTPQVKFWLAMARAKVSRLQSWLCVIGCSHKPKPWRMPMESVTMAAPQASTCSMESFLVEIDI